jgi:excisionase family DNA binding protein
MNEERQAAHKPAYTVGEVAQLLGLHRATVSGFVSRGELRSVRLGHRTVRITHEALMDFLRQKERETMDALAAKRSEDEASKGQ